MKKLLIIIFFGLFLSGNSYAQTEVEIALENCADKTFNNWEDESYKKTMGSRKGAIVRKWKKNEKGEDYIIMKKGKRYEGRSNSQEFSTTYFEEYGILIEKEAPKIIKVGGVLRSGILS